MHGMIRHIEYFLPDKVLSTEDLTSAFPEWSVEKIDAKTGIHDRHIAAATECASDLAVAAAQKLLRGADCQPADIDFIILCTQSPDYLLPSTSCLIQSRLGIPTHAGAFDFNLGCSGFVYGLGICEGLIASSQANTILLLTADTYSRHLNKSDKGARTIFGDGAAATLVAAHPSQNIGPFVWGTDGRGAKDLFLPNSGLRQTDSLDEMVDRDPRKLLRSRELYMNGPKIFDFALKTVPSLVQSLLAKAEMQLDEIDLFILHQANRYLLDELRQIMKIPTEKFQITISHCGNTVSSTIPIALKHAELEGRLKDGDKVMLVGFGVGLSWAATILQYVKTAPPKYT
jgi:3-oxoacyl-[acyl-carrier-protein] synthase-3